MQIAKVSQDQILESFRNRLIDAVPDFFGPDNVYFDDEPLPRQSPDFNYCCSLAVSNGVFGTDGSANPAQPPCFLNESCHIMVTPMVRMESEQPHNLNLSLVYDRTTGLVTQIKPRILSALLVEYDASQTPAVRRRWEPKLSNGTAMLLNSLNITGCSAPQQVRDYPFLGMTIEVRVSWIWQI